MSSINPKSGARYFWDFTFKIFSSLCFIFRGQFRNEKKKLQKFEFYCGKSHKILASYFGFVRST